MANILLVEDYESLRTIYVTTLTREKHTVQAASNAEEGLNLAAKSEFDIIILDLLMPHSDGFDFLRAFEPQKHPLTGIIILSNIFTPDIMNRAFELGAGQYLLKSDITPQHLASIVRETHAEKNHDTPKAG